MCIRDSATTVPSSFSFIARLSIITIDLLFCCFSSCPCDTPQELHNVKNITEIKNTATILTLFLINFIMYPP